MTPALWGAFGLRPLCEGLRWGLLGIYALQDHVKTLKERLANITSKLENSRRMMAESHGEELKR